MNSNSAEKNLFDVMIISNTLMSRYDEWKDNVEIISAINSDNIIRNKITQMYHDTDEKVIQSITLAFLMYLYMNIMWLFK